MRMPIQPQFLAPNGFLPQVWDATVTEVATGRPIALFRCTQLILYPKK